MIQLPILAPVYRIVIVGLLIALGIQQVALIGARAQRDRAGAKATVAVSEAAVLRDVAAGNSNTILQLKAANKALVGALAAQQTALDEAAASIDDARKAAIAAGPALREKERHDRAKPQCQLVLNTDVGGPCPALADGVRARANRRVSDS
jgi:hypothetical protein